MFPEIAFCCEWFAEDEFFYRYHPSQSTPIARAERERHVATLYLTRAEYPDFFLETQMMPEARGEDPSGSMIEPMTKEEAHQWMLTPDVKLLALFYPGLPKAEIAAVGGDQASTRNSDQPTTEPNDQNYPDAFPF